MEEEVIVLPSFSNLTRMISESSAIENCESRGGPERMVAQPQFDFIPYKNQIEASNKLISYDQPRLHRR